MPSASGWPSSTSCAAGSGAARGRRPACCSTTRRSGQRPGRGSRSCARPTTASSIAEEDLRLRGPGEVLGLRQSGVPDFRFADLGRHQDLLAAARDLAEQLVDADPALAGEAGAALRVLLHLFERHDAVRLLAAG